MCSLTLKLTSFITYSNFWNTDCLIPIYTSEFEISSRRISCSFYPWGEDLYRHSLILGERTYIGTAWWPILLCTYLHNEIFVELKKAKCINVFVLTNNVLYTSTYKNIIKMHEFSAGYLLNYMHINWQNSFTIDANWSYFKEAFHLQTSFYLQTYGLYNIIYVPCYK